MWYSFWATSLVGENLAGVSTGVWAGAGCPHTPTGLGSRWGNPPNTHQTEGASQAGTAPPTEANLMSSCLKQLRETFAGRNLKTHLF